MNRIRKLLVLPFREKKLLVQSLFLVVVIRIGLWIFPFRWVNKWASFADLPEDDIAERDWPVIDQVTLSVRAASRYVPAATCLTQALATRALLRLRGQNSRLRIGVDKDQDDKLMAHAWIEVDGRIIIGSDPRQQRFRVLEPSDRAFL